MRSRYQIICFAHPPGHDNLECRDIISVHVCGCVVAGETAPGPSSGHVQASSAQWLQEYLGSQRHWWVGVSDLLQCSVVTWGGSTSLALRELRLTVSASVEGIFSQAVCVVWGLDQRYFYRLVWLWITDTLRGSLRGLMWKSASISFFFVIILGRSGLTLSCGARSHLLSYTP